MPPPAGSWPVLSNHSHALFACYIIGVACMSGYGEEIKIQASRGTLGLQALVLGHILESTPLILAAVKQTHTQVIPTTVTTVNSTRSCLHQSCAALCLSTCVESDFLWLRSAPGDARSQRTQPHHQMKSYVSFSVQLMVSSCLVSPV